MSITNGSEGSLGNEDKPSLTMAVTRNLYKIPDKILDNVQIVSSDVATSIHSCKPENIQMLLLIYFCWSLIGN